MAGKIIAIVFGVLGLLAGAALVAGAIGVLTEDRDADGFYVTDDYAFERSSNAIVSEDLDILTDAPGWVIDVIADPIDLRISAAADGSGDLFVGVAPTADVDRYLSGVAHHEVTDVDFDGRTITNVDYEAHDGTATPPPPAGEPFWEISTEGVGPLTLDWDLDSGNWTAVLMNADGSAGIDADLSFGAKVSNITAIAWGVLGFGVFSLLGGAYLVYRGARRSPDGQSPPRHLGTDQTDIDIREPADVEPPPAEADLAADEPVRPI